MAHYKASEAQDWAWETLKGQWSTLITPFEQNGDLDEQGLRNNIRHVKKLGTRGAGCTWGMGEFWSLTHDERVRVMDIVAEEAGGKWPVAAHVTHTSSRETVDLAKHAESVGFDLLVVAAPYMEAKTEGQVIEYVKTLSENTNLGIMFYNSPQFGIVMSPQGLKQICELPQVVGVKEASFNQQLSIETHLSLGKDYVISTPNEWIYPFAQDLGFQQQVMFANTSDWRFDTPEANYYVQFIERASAGVYDDDFYEAHLRRLNELSETWWIRTADKNGGALPVAMIKYWGELMGMAGGPTRQPLPQFSAAEKAQLKEELTPLKPKTLVTKTPYKPRATWLTGNNAFATGMLLMVSVQNVEEALEAERGGADVVDVKNLQEALVGSGHPTTVRQVRAQIQPENHVSITLGVVPNQAGTVAMAAYAAAVMDATSVKIGFMQTEYDTAVEILKESRRAMDGYNTKLVGSLFADNLLYEGGLDPKLMVQLATDGECDGFLIDTLIKDGRNLFDFLTEAELHDMVLEGKKRGLSTALSGHLKLDDLDELARINPDIVGVRGAVCSTGDRDRAVAWEAVAEFKKQVDLRKSGEISVRPNAAGTNGDAPVVTAGGGWVVIDGRGKSCAGVIAALEKQTKADHSSMVETILGDALNIFDVILWTEKGGHVLVNQRDEGDGTVRVLIQPKA
jgi:uncharacterized protein (UPF0264 family)/dihydrodipicolinate synthase/N-acetylneuraminate lyase/TusA-related sulfurtransferase